VNRWRGKLTVGIKAEVRPAVVKVGLLCTYADGLDLAHGTGRRTEFLEVGYELDETHDESERDFPGEAFVLAVAEGGNVGFLALGVELVCVRGLLGVAASLALLNG
jgi:hypothetical protein